MSLDRKIEAVTTRIRARSASMRVPYLERLDRAVSAPVARARVSCTNFAHAIAAIDPADKLRLREIRPPNLAIISAYNDILSAHQPFQRFPEIIKQAARKAGAVAQFAGGVPAMCDGVTQGQPGMELSLFSRDVIAMATAVALSHEVFDAVLYLGVCDKIVPGLLIGALHFGHLPAIFVPAGPMATGLSNDEKAQIRQLHAQGEVDRATLLEAELNAYHGPGTCTFYGTANSNQMLMEVMGLHLPGAAFVSPNTPLRDALTAAAAQRAVQLTSAGNEFTPVGRIIDEKAIVNGIVGLLATGGSTNHTMHLVAIARAAGIHIDWSDFSELSAVVPSLARIYPNGRADVNHFHAAGGIGFLIRELLESGLLHEDVQTVAGPGLSRYSREPFLLDEQLSWREAPLISGDEEVVRPCSRAFTFDGGLKLLIGNLGRAIIKVSAVKPAHRVVEAPALVFDSQAAVLAAFENGDLNRDFIAVLRFQGPRANGMPELHKLTPALQILQDQGHKVALITDGRMSGASGKVPAAIHITPECQAGGPLARIQNGDLILLDSTAGILQVRLSDEELARRPLAQIDLAGSAEGYGRELFASARDATTSAEQGAISFMGAQPH